MSQPSASDSHTDRSLVFKCTQCAGKMEDWRDGSTCSTCLTKAAPAKKPAAGAKKPAAGSAGNVQSEFPSCPGCGVPSPDGNVCEDCRANRDREHKMGDLSYAQTEHDFQAAQQDAEEENERREIRARARRRMARLLGLDEDDVKKAVDRLEDLVPAVVKSAPEHRFSYAPMYMPGRLDAHGEFVKSADELQTAAWEYVRKTGHDRTVFLQHIDKPAGEWVEITSWPYAVEAPMSTGDGKIRKATFPAGTVYMGVIWEPWAWEMVKKGRLLGFSMGGWAKRVEAELIEKSAGHHDNGEDWTAAGVVNPQSPGLTGKLPAYDLEVAARILAEGGGGAAPFDR